MAADPPPVGPASLRLTGVKTPVRPGERPTIASVTVTVAPNIISMVPLGSSVAWTVTVRVDSKPRTLHQVTVYRSDAAFRKMRPLPVVGSRSERNTDTRGGPVSSRATLRSVLDLS